MPLFSFHNQSARDFIERELHHVGVGQRIRFEGRMFQEAFPTFEHNGEVWTHREAFLERRMGSAYGTWTCKEIFERGQLCYEVAHHEEQSERVYWSPDRKLREVPHAKS